MVAWKSARAFPARAYVTIRTTVASAQVGVAKIILRICSVSLLLDLNQVLPFSDPALGQSRQKPAESGACQAHFRLARCAQDECKREPILSHARSAKHKRACQTPNAYQ